MTMDPGKRDFLGRAFISWAKREREGRGDLFATENEIATFEQDPLAFVDMLKGEDAKRFFDHLVEVPL